MTNNEKYCPPPREVQDFQFKQASVSQICEEFQNIPTNSSLIAADGKRGLLYIGQESKLIIAKPQSDSGPEWKFELNLQDRVSQIALSCDCSLLAATFDRSAASIYDTTSIDKHKLNLLHKIRLSATGQDVVVSDIKWNPAIPELICSVSSDYTIACFQVSKDKTQGVQIIGMEKTPGFEALCVSWSPKGKQIVVGCKNGDIVQLKPELKMARHLTAPNPSEGMIISILWVSNYQFCACYYHSLEQRISVMIVDAPKGVTSPRYTNYEDVTFGSGSIDNICYYFEHIAEWGIIIAASTHSSEVAVLGTSDNGATWNLWQLMDDSTAQLPLNRKKKIENYPVGMSIDKSITHKLPWGESTLPNPVPILRILVTSGQLCSYNMVNLKENIPVICAAPTEFIPAPELPRPSLAPSEVSFNLATGATSTPRTKQNVPETNVEKPKAATNVFANSVKSFSFLTPNNKVPSQIIPQNEAQAFAPSELAEVKANTNFVDQENGKVNLQQDKTQKTFTTQIDDQKKNKPILQPVNVQPEIKSVGLSLKPDNKIEFKNPVAPVPNQIDPKLNKEVLKESTQKQPDESKSKEMPAYDDGICLRAYYEEQARFEKELKSRLNLPSWNCGTEDERQMLVKKSNEIDEFLRELKETTNSLASDIAYLKALLLQSFAWVEETKSKNSASANVGNRNRIEGNKLADLQRLYYYTQSQLVQATKVLDLEWAEHNDRNLTRMKIPSLEIIYQTLIRYTQIIDKEKKNVDELTKKWRNIERGSSSFTNSLDKSMSSLNISQPSSTQLNDTAIDLRCKLIASNTRNLSKDKQTKLRDLLSESAPTIVRAARPTAVQDRLEATLSSLAAKSTEVTSKANRVTKVAVSKSTPEQGKLQSQNSLSSLNSLVSGIGTTASPLSRSPTSATPFSSFGLKSTPPKSKDNVPQQQTQVILNTPKVTTQSPKDSSKPPIVTAANKFTGFPSPKPTSSFPTTTPTTLSTSFATVPKMDASIPFKFPTKPTEQQQVSTPEASVDFSGLSFNSRATTASSLFGKPPPVITTISKVPPGPNATSPGTLASPLSIPSLTSTAPNPISTASASLFGTSTMFEALGTSSTSPMTFKPPSTGAVVTTAASSTATITTSVCPATIPFGGIPSTAPSTAPSFAGILGSTASLNFGSPTSTNSIVPPFSKSSAPPVANIFGSTSPSSIFSKSDSNTATASATSSPSLFGTPTATTSGSLTFGNQVIGSSTSGNSFFASKPTPSTAASGPIFEGSATDPPTNSIFGNTSSGSNLTTFAVPSTTTPKSNAFETSSTTQSNGSLVFGGGAMTQSTGSTIFGNTTITPSSGTVFGGSTSVPSTGTPVFGSNATTQSTGSPVFGNTATTQSSGTSVFGGTASTQSTGTLVFGSATTQNSGIPVFGASSTTPNTGSSLFGTPSTTQTGSSIFGSSTTQSNGTSVFGNSSTTQSSGTTGFFSSSTTQSTAASPFGSSTTQSNGTSIFGGSATAPGSTSIFGNASSTLSTPMFKPAASTTTTTMGAATSTVTNPVMFGSPASSGAGSMFSGGTTATGASVFNPSTTPSTSIFGSQQPATANLFGAGTTNAGSTQPGTGGLFGTGGVNAGTTQATTPNLFGTPAANAATPQLGTGGMFGTGTVGTGSAIFGAPPTMGTSMFGGAASTPGGAMGSSSMFGQPSAFGSKPVFGSPAADFGAAKTGFASGFSSPPSFGATSGAVFGSPSLLGTGSPLAGTSPNKVFGSSTFEALGAQSEGLSFDSLAQKTEKPQAFQGSSSFSSWR